MSKTWQTIVTMLFVLAVVYAIFFGTQMIHRARNPSPSASPPSATASANVGR